MLYNSAMMKRLTKQDRKLWVSVIDLVSDFHAYAQTKKSTRLRLIYRCHSICRAIASQIPKLTVVDGSYLGIGRDMNNTLIARFSNHSWLLLPSKKIIDPYPVGFIAMHPLMIVNLQPYANFGHGLYVPNPIITEKVMSGRLKKESQRLIEAMSNAGDSARKINRRYSARHENVSFFIV